MRFKKLIDTFLDLTRCTSVHGTEDLLFAKYAEQYNLCKDDFGNYFIKIGESRTIFCSHLDTVGKKGKKVNHQLFNDAKSRDYCVCTDRKTILGADDKAGVCVLLSMIESNKPGLYYFFLGEECGTLGSRFVLQENPNIGSEYDRIISFDRRGYSSVITRQMGGNCCSSGFAIELSNRLSSKTLSYYPDETGIFTDSAVFMNVIKECTNISVGYFNEHSVHEVQNLTFLKELIDTVLDIDWESLPSCRELRSGPSKEEIFESACIINEIIRHQYGLNIENLYVPNFFEVGKSMSFTNPDDEGGHRTFKMMLTSTGAIILRKGRLSMKFDNINDLYDDMLDNKLNKIIKTR